MGIFQNQNKNGKLKKNFRIHNVDLRSEDINGSNDL